jgi:hypothetical protein
MALLSSPLLLRTHALTLSLFAYYLLTDPAQLLSSTPIWLIGESMSLRPAAFAPEHPTDTSPRTSMNLKGLISPQSGSTSSERELMALLALLLVVYAGTMFLFAGDLTMLPLPVEGKAGSGSASGATSSRYGEELHTLLTAQAGWLAVAGIHVLGSSILVAWIYLFHSHSRSATAQSLPSESLSGLSLLANRVTFTVALVDMLFWGYLWTVLKEEGREVGRALARRRAAEDERDE